MRTMLLIALVFLGGCSTPYWKSPSYAECTAELKLQDTPWYDIGTVQAEMLSMCTKAKDEAKKA